MPHTDYRLPAEWEQQSATLLAWPHPASDWSERLPGIQQEYVQLVQAIAPRQPVVLLVPPGSDEAAERLGALPGLHLAEMPYDDTWCRDYGPITLVSGGERLALDFQFNGWGGKYPAARDNRVNTLLARHALFSRLHFRQYLFELEGGAIESDGQGTLLVNWHCLHERHPHLSRAEIEYELFALLNVQRVLGLDIEPLPGDDTDGHIDTLARFVGTDTIAWQRQPDAQRSRILKGQLDALERADGQAYRLLELPHPEGVDPTLPANYVNFVFVNGACLVPAYGVETDTEAREILAETLPKRDVESVPASVMIEQYGGPHCASMHIPAALP
ncbi:agmatine deiminase family protein [Wenzhouxiangella limi]|uniref:Agmatine deiminase family protein n=1 Tax=Wenzhouxiangella limi TaxID=2707351 RepID=A0A845UZC7_9GAMM|nr:agmatine deiminase family protein [Wenzhouxiangella limi]NDY94416.1 agmatine deiminase family protein [Wenzhouxiangella limi]